MSTASSENPLRILVADDEPMIVRALVRVLEKKGHSVAFVATADAGVEAIGGEKFDAVIVDQNMPGSGLAILRHLFGTDFDGFAALMTGGIDDGEIDALDGPVTRLQKPFRFQEVVSIIEENCG